MQVYRCNDHVPEAVYWELPKRIQNQVRQRINTGNTDTKCPLCDHNITLIVPVKVEIDTSRPPAPQQRNRRSPNESLENFISRAYDDSYDEL